MRKLAIGTVIGIVGMLFGSLAAEAQTKSRLQQIAESGTLRIGVTGDWNPMSFRDPNTRELAGFDIDLFSRLAKEMGVKAEFVPTDWKTLVSGLTANKYDVTCSASISTQRAMAAGFTDPYFELTTVPLAAKAVADRFKTWDDINKPDVTVAATLGTVQEQQVKQYFPNAKIRIIEAPARDYQEVLGGRAQVHVTSNVEALTLNKTHPNLVPLFMDKGRDKRPIAALVPQNDQAWINFLNHWIKMKKSDGFLDQISQKWLPQG